MSITKGLPFVYIVMALAFIACSYVHAGKDARVNRNISGRWCIANPLRSNSKLQSDIDYLCNGVVDCSSIKPGGACFNPNTVSDHVSVLFNIYYKAKGTCSFAGDAMLTVTDPSSGSCIYHWN